MFWYIPSQWKKTIFIQNSAGKVIARAHVHFGLQTRGYLACEQALSCGGERGVGGRGRRGKRAYTHPIVLRIPPRKPAARDLSNLIQSACAGNESVSCK